MRTDRISDRDGMTGIARKDPKFLTGYVTVVAGVGATRVITFAVSLLLARRLGVAGFGAYSLAYTLLTLVAQLPATLDASYVRYHGLSEGELERRGLLRGLLLSKAGAAAVVAVFAVALLPAVDTGGSAPATGLLLLGGVAAGACFAVANTQLSYEQAHERFARYSGFSLGTNVMSAVALLAYIATSDVTPLGSMLVFNTWPYALVAAAVFVYLWSQSRGGPPAGAFVRRLLRFNAWLVPANVMYIVLQRIDVLILAHLSTYAAVGRYSAAVTVSSVVSLFTSNLQTVFLPRATRALGSRQALRRFAVEAAASTAGIALLVAAAVALAPELIDRTVGPEYAGAAGPLRILLAGYAIIAASVPLQSVAYASGRTKLIFWQRALELVTATTLAFLLIPRAGLEGAAFAMAASAGAGLAFLGLSLALRRDAGGRADG
jgi:O-antigen/teichoic acid export membrane protein